VGIAILILATFSNLAAAKSLKNAQINYILSNSQWDLETTCGYNGQGRWTGPAKFSADGSFHADTHCQKTRGFQAEYNGKWNVADDRLCFSEIRSTNPSGGRMVGFEDGTCFVVEEGRFGYQFEPDDRGRTWDSRLLKHPGHTHYKELSIAANKVRVSTVVATNQPKTVSEAASDSARWEAIKYSTQISDFQRYLETYPNGLFAALAESQIRDLVKQQANPDAATNQFAGIDFGTYHALVIGINDYKHITKLATAVSDAKAIAEMLERDYGFKVTLLLNSRRDDILDAFDDYLETLGAEDNLLIYYAGHGWLDEATDRGYWLPADAKQGRRSRWLSNADITDTLKSLAAKHVMLVADSCYSGTLTRSAAVGIRDKDYIKRMSKKKARIAMVSGGLEPVADSGGSGFSPFAKAFLDALTANPNIVDGTRLFSQIRRPVILNAQQTPEYSDVRNSGHDGGDFLFVRKH
jgi:hypothetical protein